MRVQLLILLLVILISWRTPDLFAAEVNTPGQTEWEKTVEAAKKEAKLVAGIPASAELRKSITESFKSRFPGIELELTTSRGPTNASSSAAHRRPLTCSTPVFSIPSSRYSSCRRSKIRSAGSAATSGSTAPSVSSMPFKPTSRKTFGTIRPSRSRRRFVPTTIS